MAPDTSISRKVKDIGAGFVGGAVQVLVGQPFDLVKVRLQTGQFSNATQAVVQTLKNEGPFAFYKGTLAPLVGVGACVSVQFYAFHETKRQILLATKRDRLSWPAVYFSGAMAGLANTVISSPVEQVRVMLQTQRTTSHKHRHKGLHVGAGAAETAAAAKPTSAAAAAQAAPSSTQATKSYSGPVQVARDVIAQKGVARGLYRGFSVTALREMQAYGVWFLTYEYLVSLESNRREIPTWRLMTYGALAGEALWLSSYPLDVIKSKVQTSPISGSLNARQAAVATWKSQGWQGFWKGLTPTLLRAVPASACTFASVELTLRVLG